MNYIYKNNIPEFLLNSSTYLIVCTDIKGTITYFNDAYSKLFPNLTSQGANLNILSSVHPADVEIIKKSVEQCFKNPKEPVSLQIRKPLPNSNRYSWSHWEFSIITDSDNTIQGVLCIGIDITENLEMFENIKEFSERVETIIQNFNDGFFVVDKEWKFKSSNSITEKYFNKTKHQLTEGTIWEIDPEIESSTLGKSLKKCMDNKESFQVSDYYPRTNQWLKATLYYSEKGIAVFLRDITAEHNYEKQLLESQMRLNALVNSSSSVNILISLDKKIMHFNRNAMLSCKKIFNKELAEGQNFLEVCPPVLQSKFNSTFDLALNGDTIIKEDIIPFGQNEEYWHKITYSPVYKSKELIGISLDLENIHDSKIAQIENNYLSKTLRALYNSSRYSKLMISKDYKVIFFNRVASAFVKREFGITMERNGHVFDYISKEILPDFKSFIDQALDGKICQKEYVALFPKSGKAWIKLEIYPVYDENKSVIGVSYNAIDITKKKQDELTIQKQSKKLKEIAFTQSHIIRKPVANLIGLVNLVDSDKLDEDQQFIMSKIKESLSELDSVIYDLVGKSIDDSSSKLS
ncbi:MAG: PAS domain-containing protein [Bacteroidia bacterium]